MEHRLLPPPKDVGLMGGGIVVCCRHRGGRDCWGLSSVGVGDAGRSWAHKGTLSVTTVGEVGLVGNCCLLPSPEEVELMGDHHILPPLEKVATAIAK